MSRVGKMPIKIPAGVTITSDKDVISVNGPKGNLRQFTMPGITISQEADQLLVSRADDEQTTRAKHGLMRSLLDNMVTGVSQGFTKKLEIHGVGYRVAQQGSELRFSLGFSHDVVYKVPAGVQVGVEQNTITISGADKQQVGQVAAEIRSLKKPEPYKGKGIRYTGEHLLRKSGKSGKEV